MGGIPGTAALEQAPVSRIRQMAAILLVVFDIFMNRWVSRSGGGLGAVLALFLASSPVRSQVIINEIMYHPPPAIPEAPGKEWIELYNAGTNAVDLTGWRLTKGVSFTFTNLTIPVGGYLVVAADQAVFATNYPGVTNVVGNWTGKLRNSGDTIELHDATGQQVDSVTYANEGDWALRRVGDAYPGQPSWWAGWKWFTPADGSGRSLELLNPALPNSSGQNWAVSLADGGTPGRPNSVATNHIAPMILDARHLPAIPRSTNSVIVTARIVQETGSTATVSLFYRVDGAASFTSVPMVDDGAHGDALVGDGVYGAVLPPEPDKTVVEFYVQAHDAAGRTRTWPGPTDDLGTQAANALYQVDESTYSGNQPIYRLVTKAAEWNAWLNLMDAVSNGRYSDAEMNGTVVRVDGVGLETRYCVGIRNRGAGTRAAHPHNLHFRFPADHLLQGLGALDFNTRTVHSQVAGNAIFSAADLLNAYGAPVQVRVNGVNLANASPTGGTDSFQFGSYYCFQPYDSGWAAAHIPQDGGGNIYKGVWYLDWVQLVRGANLDYLGTSLAPYELVYSPTGPQSTSGPYSKQSNTSEDDWSDLTNLTYTLSTSTPDASYLQAVGQVANIDQWLRYFAVNSLIINMETTVATGVGDDYSMYRGVLDPRFQLVNHDLDTVLGQGDATPDYARSIFKAGDLPAVNRFLKHPDIASRYYATLKQMADTVFSPPQIGPIIEQTLGSWVPDTYIQAMKGNAERRRTNVLAQIPLHLTVQSPLTISSGYPYTTSPATSLSGLANAIDTRSVVVNGAAVTYVPWQAAWSASNVALRPGINRIWVQAFDSQGFEIERATIDIWYNDGTSTTVGGAIASDTTWSAAGGPYNVSSSITVNPGVTLTIQPGTTLYLDSGVNFVVANGGRLLAQGTATAPIRFTVAPGSGVSWGGMTINGAVGSPENVITYTHFEGNSATCIEVAAGSVTLDHVTFGTTSHQYLSLDGASFLISHCTFPTTSAAFELVHGTGGIKAGGRGIVRDCFFGTTTGYNDIMDFTGGNRDLGQPIIQYYNNLFTGASDDVLDLDGTDAWIEGNIFLHVHKNGAPDSSSGVSGGDYDFGTGAGGVRTSEITIVRNIFFDCDQATTAKQGDFFTLLNNTIVHVTKTGGTDIESAVVNVQDAIPTPPTTYGKGFYLEGNIVVDAPELVRNYDPNQSVVTFTNNLLPLAWSGPGGGNSTNDPMLKYIPQVSEAQFSTWEQAQVMWDWFSLRPGSPAVGTGPNGVDMGAAIPSGASIAGEPPALTSATNAALTVGFLRTGNGIPASGFPQGSGYTQYKWRLDGGSWSAETPTAAPITLSGLPSGQHHVEVVGKRDSGWYQDAVELGADAVTTSSRTWTVDTTWRGLMINELLADNRNAVRVNDTAPDAIELYNGGLNPIDLSGMALTDNTNVPARFTFPTGASIAPGGYFVLYADKNPGTNHAGFGLDKLGGSLYLLDTAAAGRTLIDSVDYGLQLPDLSIGRLPSGQWALTQPTFGAPNLPVPTGDIHRLRINEWLAASVAGDDFVELFNPDPVPVNLGGCFLSDTPDGWPTRNRIPALSFIPADGLLPFIADGQAASGANHLNFKLDFQWGLIALFAPDLSMIDQVAYGPQTADVSMGRSPNGSDQITTFPIPTPGGGNPGMGGSGTVSNYTVHLMSYPQVWRYNQTQNLDAVNWTATNYNDSAWPAGPGLLAYENNTVIAPLIKTTLNDPRVPQGNLLPGHADYFRTTLNVTSDLSKFTITANYRLDDGGMFYLNGQPLQPIRMPGGTILNRTLATGFPLDPTGGTDATADETFTFPGSLLTFGANVFAVSVHQVNTNSSDITFGLALDATSYVTNYVTPTAVLNEVMANNRSVTNDDGSITDWVELYNPSSTSLPLDGMALTDSSAALNHRWSFPTGITLPGHGRLVVRFDSSSAPSTNAGPGLNTGFALDADGDKVFLYSGTALLDAVSFGAQAQDYTIARVPDGTGSWTLSLPSPGTANLSAPLAGAEELRVNEYMADPKSGDDWFELYNPNSQPVALGGYHLTDDLTKPTQFTIPSLSFIGAAPYGAYLVLHADGTPTNGPTHTNFKLSAGGETIAIFAPDGLATIDVLTFGQQAKGVSEGFFPDGSTNLTRFPRTPTPGSANYLPFTDVLLNEALSRPASGSQQIELFNQTDQVVDLSGAWLSDDLVNAQKFRLPDSTILPPGGFLVLDESQFNPRPGWEASFGLDPINGGTLYLSLADSDGKLTGYRSWAKLGGADPGVSFGQYETGAGPEFVAMSALSFGGTNPYPRVGPLVINEIHYHPPDIGTNDNTGDEFIELLNITGATMPLFDPAFPTNTWHLRNAISYDFPTNVTLPSGACLLVVSFDPLNDPLTTSSFRQKFAVPSNVPLYGPWNGRLNNGGETLELNKPSGIINGLIPRVLVERVQFNNEAPWPTAADGLGTGTGFSLQRRAPAGFGNDPVNWVAAAPTAGTMNNPPGGSLPTFTLQPVSQLVLPGGGADFTAAAVGTAPLFYQWRLNGLDLLDATNATLSLTNVGWPDSGRYSVRVSNPWGCLLSSNALLRLQTAPAITRQPLGGTANGAPFVFDVVARGTAPLSYQWHLYGTNLPGATAATLVLPAPQSAQAGPYAVVVANSFGSITSAVATLAVGVLDSDNDGIPDWWMLQYFGHPTGQSLDNSLANQDADGDGLSNLQEYWAGTSPVDAASALRLVIVSSTSGPSVTLSFQAMSNHAYIVQLREGLGGPWTNFATVQPANLTRAIALPDTAGTANRFYRVVTWP